MKEFLQSRWFSACTGIGIFIIVLINIDVGQMITLLSDVELGILSLAILGFPIMYLVKVWRWQFFLKNQAIHISWPEAISFYLLGSFAGIVTPGRLGEFMKVIYIKQKGYSYGRALVSVLLDRFYDVLLLLVICCLALASPLFLFKKEVFLLVILILLFCVAGIFFFARIDMMKAISRKLFGHLIPEMYRRKIGMNFDEFYRDIRGLTPRVLWPPFVITMLFWVVQVITSYLMAISLKVEINLLYFILCISAVAVISLLPISVSGIGTREVTYIFMFSQVGIGKEIAVAFSILELLCLYGITGVLVLLSWLYVQAYRSHTNKGYILGGGDGGS